MTTPYWSNTGVLGVDMNDVAVSGGRGSATDAGVRFVRVAGGRTVGQARAAGVAPSLLHGASVPRWSRRSRWCLARPRGASLGGCHAPLARSVVMTRGWRGHAPLRCWCLRCGIRSLHIEAESRPTDHRHRPSGHGTTSMVMPTWQGRLLDGPGCQSYCTDAVRNAHSINGARSAGYPLPLSGGHGVLKVEPHCPPAAPACCVGAGGLRPSRT